MQYKIPVQIENEDTIFLGLSIRQLAIIMIGGGIAYSIFKSLQSSLTPQIASIPAVLVLIVTLFIALFKNAEMPFLPFIPNLIRLNLNDPIRKWAMGIESFSGLEIGYVTSYTNAKVKGENKGSFHEMDEEMSDRLKKL